MKTISAWIVEIFIDRKVISPKDKSIYIYGLNLWIYTLVSTLSIIALGLFTSYLYETLILIFLFYKHQSLGGGYHATTHLRCYFCMICSSIAYFSVLRVLQDGLVYLIGGICSIVLLWRFPLTLHANKLYLAPKYNILVRRSREFILFSFFIWLISLSNTCSKTYEALSLSLIFCALSRITAVYQREKRTRRLKASSRSF